MKPAKASQIMARVKADALLVSNLINLEYLTDLKVSYGFLLVTPRQFTLFLDGRYLDKATKQVSSHIKVRSMDQLPKRLQKFTSCGFEADTVTVAQLQGWKKSIKGPKFIATKGVIEDFRRTKDSTEISRFKKSQRLTHKLLTRVPAWLKAGVTEIEVARRMEQWAYTQGAEGLSFDPIVAFGTNTTFAHHQATKRVLKKGQLVQIDVGIKYQGYCSDQSRVFFTGIPTAQQKLVFEALAHAKDEATKKARAGMSTRDLDRAARDVLKSYSLDQYFTHALGHGVGLEIHEGVSISPKAENLTLRAGEIITIEPGVYIPGKFGMRLEDEVIIK